MEVGNFPVTNYILVVVLTFMMVCVGVLVWDKQGQAVNDCRQFGAVQKFSNSSCDFWNSDRECQVGLCVWPNGTEFWTTDLLAYNPDIEDWGVPLALVITLSIVLTVIISFIARWTTKKK
jgi:hypothetical protein